MALDLTGWWCAKRLAFVFTGSIDSSFSCDAFARFLYWGPVTLETELGSSSVYRMSPWRIGVNSFLNVWGKLTSKGLWAWGFSLGEVLNDEFHLFVTGRLIGVSSWLKPEEFCFLRLTLSGSSYLIVSTQLSTVSTYDYLLSSPHPERSALGDITS